MYTISFESLPPMTVKAYHLQFLTKQTHVSLCIQMYYDSSNVNNDSYSRLLQHLHHICSLTYLIPHHNFSLHNNNNKLNNNNSGSSSLVSRALHQMLCMALPNLPPNKTPRWHTMHKVPSLHNNSRIPMLLAIHLSQ